MTSEPEQSAESVVVRYRKKPVVIEAVRWFKAKPHCTVVYKFMGDAGAIDIHGDLLIPTLEGMMKADEGDWIIKGVKGEFYPCKPDIFDATYELVNDGRDDAR